MLFLEPSSLHTLTYLKSMIDPVNCCRDRLRAQVGLRRIDTSYSPKLLKRGYVRECKGDGLLWGILQFQTMAQNDMTVLEWSAYCGHEF